MIYAVEYTVGFGYFGILSNLSAASIRIESNSNRTHRRISCLVRKCFLHRNVDATSHHEARLFALSLGRKGVKPFDDPNTWIISDNLRGKSLIHVDISNNNSISPELLTFHPGDCMKIDVTLLELIGNEPPPSDYSLTRED